MLLHHFLFQFLRALLRLERPHAPTKAQSPRHRPTHRLPRSAPKAKTIRSQDFIKNKGAYCRQIQAFLGGAVDESRARAWRSRFLCCRRRGQNAVRQSNWARLARLYVAGWPLSGFVALHFAQQDFKTVAQQIHHGAVSCCGGFSTR